LRMMILTQSYSLPTNTCHTSRISSISNDDLTISNKTNISSTSSKLAFMNVLTSISFVYQLLNNFL
jgi:hypothetical protein